MLEARCISCMVQIPIWGLAFSCLEMSLIPFFNNPEILNPAVFPMISLVCFAWGIWAGTLPAYCLCHMLPELLSPSEKFRIYSWSCRWPLWVLAVLCSLRVVGRSPSLIAAVLPLFIWAAWAHSCDTHGIDWKSF